MSSSFYVSHPVELVPQPTDMSCWAAAASMVLGNQSTGPGGAALQSGGLVNTVANVRTFARAYGLQVHPYQSWSVDGLRDLLERHGPLWVGGLVPNGHAYVIAGLWGDGTSKGTTMRIYDPWPPRVGRVYDANVDDFLSTNPLATLFILHRPQRRPI